MSDRHQGAEEIGRGGGQQPVPSVQEPASAVRRTTLLILTDIGDLLLGVA